MCKFEQWMIRVTDRWDLGKWGFRLAVGMLVVFTVLIIRDGEPLINLW